MGWNRKQGFGRLAAGRGRARRQKGRVDAFIGSRKAVASYFVSDGNCLEWRHCFLNELGIPFNLEVKRVVKASAKPVTALSVMLEWQHDWAFKGTCATVMNIAKTHFGAYGVGVEHA
jgi:hypothetical protein